MGNNVITDFRKIGCVTRFTWLKISFRRSIPSFYKVPEISYIGKYLLACKEKPCSFEYYRYLTDKVLLFFLLDYNHNFFFSAESFTIFLAVCLA